MISENCARANDKKFYTNYFSVVMNAIDGDKLLISQEYLMISENERLRQICQSLSFWKKPLSDISIERLRFA